MKCSSAFQRALDTSAEIRNEMKTGKNISGKEL
jgi:hypothetical protein